MLKKTLSVAAATIAIVASASLPAAAVPGCADPITGEAKACPVETPEPSTILGSIVVVGALLGKKGLDAKNASK